MKFLIFVLTIATSSPAFAYCSIADSQMECLQREMKAELESQRYEMEEQLQQQREDMEDLEWEMQQAQDEAEFKRTMCKLYQYDC